VYKRQITTHPSPKTTTTTTTSTSTNLGFKFSKKYTVSYLSNSK